MVSGRAKVMQQTDPRKCKVTYKGVHRGNSFDSILDGNPRIAKVGERGDFQELQARDRANNRPYHLGKTPEFWTYNPTFRPEVGEIYFTEQEIEFGKRHAGRVIVEPHVKHGASPNKNWGWIRWNKLAWLLRKQGIVVAQFSTGPMLDISEQIQTQSFREACAVLKYSRVAVLHEGGLHHAAAAVGLPAVVIFGGYIPIELTGYDMHVNLGASLGDACGMRVPCSHCAGWMARIAPEEVADKLMGILNVGVVTASVA